MSTTECTEVEIIEAALPEHGTVTQSTTQAMIAVAEAPPAVETAPRQRKAKPAANIVFTEAENRLVAAINKLEGEEFEIIVAKGRLVAEHGGTVYGEGTLERLAQHPDLHCSDETLRRCWRISQLMDRYGDRLRQAAPTLKAGHFYELSRLLQIPDSTKGEVAVFALAKVATEAHLIPTDLGARVTNHLDRMLVKPKREKPATSITDQASCDDKPIYAALFDSSKAAVEAVERITAAEPIRWMAKVNKAANRLGFAYCRLVERLVQSGEQDVATAARKVIDRLTVTIKEGQHLRSGQDSQTRLVFDARTADARQAGSDEPSLPAAEPAVSEITLAVAKGLDWPSECGMKVVIPARAMKAAIKSACIAALSEEGQGAYSSDSSETRGCVIVTATNEGIVFESAVPRFCSRYLASAPDGTTVVEEGIACVDAKALKRTCSNLIRGADAISLSFAAKLADVEDSRDRDEGMRGQPDGMVTISAVRGNKVVATASIDSYPTTGFLPVEFPTMDDVKVVLAGRASAFMEPYRSVAFAINPYDVNVILSKMALFDGGEVVYFVGTDGRRCAIAPAKKSGFDMPSDFAEHCELPRTDAPGDAVENKRPIPVLIDAEYLAPILAAASGDDIMTMAVDEDGESLFVFCGASAYRIYRLEKYLASKYPDYRRMLAMPFGAAILVNREDCLAAVGIVRQKNKDSMNCTYSEKKGIITLSGRLNETVATSVLSYRLASDSPLRREAVCMPTDHFHQAVKQMQADEVRISFSTDELRVRLEDAINPQFAYFMQAMIPSEASVVCERGDARAAGTN